MHLQTHGEKKQHHTQLCDTLQLLNRMDRHGSRGVRHDDDTSNDEAQYRPIGKSLKQDDTTTARRIDGMSINFNGSDLF